MDSPENIITITSASNGATAKLTKFGATLVYYSPAKDIPNVVYVSSKAIWDGTKPIRGGIPVVFPQFGSGDGTLKLPSHGFARISKWRVLKQAEDAVSLGLSYTDISPEHAHAWPFKFELEFDAALDPVTGALKTELRIKNTHEAPFDFQALLHTYLTIPDVNKVGVFGLAGQAFFDQLDKEGKTAKAPEMEPAVIIDKEVDSIFLTPAVGSIGVTVAYNRSSPPAEHSSPEANKANKVIKGMNVRPFFSMDGGELRATDVVVWNPWIEKTKKMSDLDDFHHFICVEPGMVRNKVTLGVKSVAVLGQVITPRM